MTAEDYKVLDRALEDARFKQNETAYKCTGCLHALATMLKDVKDVSEVKVLARIANEQVAEYEAAKAAYEKARNDIDRCFITEAETSSFNA